MRLDVVPNEEQADQRQARLAHPGEVHLDFGRRVARVEKQLGPDPHAAPHGVERIQGTIGRLGIGRGYRTGRQTRAQEQARRETEVGRVSWDSCGLANRLR